MRFPLVTEMYLGMGRLLRVTVILVSCPFGQVDVSYQYLTFFMEDDEELKRIGGS